MSFSFAITVGVEVQLFVAGGKDQVFPGGPLPSLLRPEGRVIHYLESLYNVASCLKVGTVAPNRIHRRFEMNIPHQKITTDTSEFKYYEADSQGHLTLHKLYLDPFLDIFNNEIISYGIAKYPSANSILEAQAEAIEITADCPYRRTFHSDQGWAYQMKSYTKRLKNERIFQSMSRKGNCHDNAVMENFFGLLQ